MESACIENLFTSDGMMLQALGPEGMKQRELDAIYNDPAIQKFLKENGQTIQEITGSTGKWRVHTEEYAIDVDVVHSVNPKVPIGSGLIELIVRDPVKIS